jgi:hypothetical protein
MSTVEEAVLADDTNDLKNTHINFEWELEALRVIQHRMAKKLSMSRELGDVPAYHAALGMIEQGSIAIREAWKFQHGEYPRRHM